MSSPVKTPLKTQPMHTDTPANESVAPGLPLAVDLDGTLLRTDTLFEAIAAQMRTRPLWTLWHMAVLPFAIAPVKRMLLKGADVDVKTLPVNQDVLDYCREARDAGRKVYLVSAADQEIVDKVAERFGIFDGAIGSDGKLNNKGSKKAERLQRDFPNGFEYIGDSPADMKVWKHAKAASHVGGGEARKRSIEAAGVKVERSFKTEARPLHAWRKQLRLHQWAKNALMFVAPILAMEIGNPDVIIKCLIAFPLLGIMASGTYIVNDLLDLAADRRHHSKFARPFAAGRIKLWQGFTAAPLMIIGAIGAGFFLSPAFAGAMTVYLVATLSYSLALKRVALLDAMVLAGLFTLRLVMGGVLAGVPLTSWLLVFSMFLFVSLSLAKRHVEVIRKTAAGERKVANRGYQSEDAALTIGLGLATAAAVPLIMVLYLMDSAWPSGLYQYPDALWAAPVIFSLWLMRVWLLANRGQLDDDPVSFAVKDPISLALGAALGLAFFAGLYLPAGGQGQHPPTPRTASIAMLDAE
jgi:4-hydroxybenzoate polyprenyltransferase/phosphoserine phosphatase